MKLEVCKEYRFEAAHSLRYHSGKCRMPHGHSYKVILCITGETQGVDGHSSSGMVMDFSFLDDIARRYVLDLDHKDLNQLFDYTTAELLVEYFVREISMYFKRMFTRNEVWLSKVRLYETEKAYVEWTPQ